MPGITKFKCVLKSIADAGEMKVETLETLTKKERELVITLSEEGLVAEALDFLNGLDADEEWEVFRDKMVGSKKHRVPYWPSFLKYAAVFVGFLAIGYLMYTGKSQKNEATIPETAIKLRMGKNKVKVITQDDVQQIVDASGVVLGEQKGNKIKYDANTKIDELVYNELEIPFGMIFDVELSDGTLVHLNSGTKMRYPVRFLSGRQREVFIDGEAYFKVSKDEDHPFVVHANEVAVEVLGTEFNVTSYQEDAEIKTVLVEGSVRMTHSFEPDKEVVLFPGRKGAWNKSDHDIKTEDVDVELYTGWINGELVFRNTSFASMEKKLERSYNVSIQNNNSSLANKILNARFHVRVESIEDVMKSIGELYAFEYDINNGQIVIN